jgi:hypothetical protein
MTGTDGREAGAGGRTAALADVGARVPARAAPALLPTITGERVMTTPSAEAMLTYWRGACRAGVGARPGGDVGLSATTC